MTVVTRKAGSCHMGAVPSRFKKKLKSRDWNWSGSPGEHSAYPTDPAPYPGYEITYCFLDIMADYRVLNNTLNLGPTPITTNIEDFMGDLEACYKEGYHLNTHLRIPGERSTMQIEDWGIRTPYHSILSKPIKTVETDVQWELRVAKCILSTRMRAFDALEGENDLLRTIQKYAESGARLCCAVPVGYVRSKTSNNQYSVMGMELFFNIPKSKIQTRYTYHAIKMPVKYYINTDATQTVQQVNCDSDLMGQMKLFLNNGWRLVDLCVDSMALAEAFRMSAPTKYVDMVWIFEKNQAKLEDDTPRYEGVILEYLHKVKKYGDGVEQPCKDWRPVIAGMGVMGWELAAMIQSPVLIQTGFTTYTIKMLMIFQRKLLPSFERLRNMKQTLSARDILFPGSHDKSNAERKGSVFQARGKSDEETGYYHQTLKKYIYSNDSIRGTPLHLCTHSTHHAIRTQSTHHTELNNRRPSVVLPNGQPTGVYPPTYTQVMRLNMIPKT